MCRIPKWRLWNRICCRSADLPLLGELFVGIHLTAERKVSYNGTYVIVFCVVSCSMSDEMKISNNCTCWMPLRSHVRTNMSLTSGIWKNTRSKYCVLLLFILIRTTHVQEKLPMEVGVYRPFLICGVSGILFFPLSFRILIYILICLIYVFPVSKFHLILFAVCSPYREKY